MTDQDNVKPYHARDTAPGKEAADVVAEVLQHAAEREEAAKKKQGPKTPPKWMLPLTVNIGVLALYFLIASPEFLIVNPVEDTRPNAEVDQQNRSTVYLYGITPIENFRDANGRLPATLEEAGRQLATFGLPVTYSATDTSYVLTVTVDGRELRFDSAVQRPEDFAPVIDLGGG